MTSYKSFIFVLLFLSKNNLSELFPPPSSGIFSKLLFYIIINCNQAYLQIILFNNFAFILPFFTLIFYFLCSIIVFFHEIIKNSTNTI